MKLRLLFAATLLVSLGFSSTLQAQVGGRAGFKISNVEVSTPLTPDFDTDYKKRSTRQSWLEIEVEFESQPDFVEELTMKYYVYIADKLLVGEVNHMSIVKGREHYSVMYISPQSLGILLDGKKVGAGDVEHVGVQLLVQGQLVAEFSSRGAPRGQWWQTAQQIPGYLLNKDQTPFAPLVWDRYEAIKSNSR